MASNIDLYLSMNWYLISTDKGTVIFWHKKFGTLIESLGVIE